jgi:uncharacterized protein DUF6879
MLSGADLYSSAQTVEIRTFGGEFATFERQARRLELLPAYFTPDEQEPLARFLRGEPIEPDFNKEWHSILKDAAARRAQVDRLRIIPDKPTPYLCFEILHGYRHSAEYGERITFLEEGEAVRQAGPGALIDHWIFDDRRMYIMIYDFRGAFLGVLRVSDAAAATYVEFHVKMTEKARSLDWALSSYAEQCLAG